MRNGKFAKRGVASKALVLILALMLVVGATIGGTLAWLTAQTEKVENTFTVGNIALDIFEHDYVPASNTLDKRVDPVKANNDYKMVPGVTLPKDPYVVVKGGSEACWLFLKVEESNNTVTGLTGKVINYTVDTTVWTEVPNHAGYYYKEITTYTANDTNHNVLANTQVTVNDDLTKTMADNMNAPKLTFSAAAVQKAEVAGVDAAWAKLPTPFTGA